jgi:hypothetical protein
MYGRTTYPCNAMTNVSIPFKSYVPCNSTPVDNKRSIGYVPPVRIPDSIAALSESDRMAKQECPAYVTQLTTAPFYDCSGSSSFSGPQTTIVPVVPGTPTPSVAVGTTPASVTMSIRAQQVQQASTNPYNPATRFSQYFPPAPIPYCRPMRYPSKDPLPSVNVCQPIRRFTGIPDTTG